MNWNKLFRELWILITTKVNNWVLKREQKRLQNQIKKIEKKNEKEKNKNDR